MAVSVDPKVKSDPARNYQFRRPWRGGMGPDGKWYGGQGTIILLNAEAEASTRRRRTRKQDHPRHQARAWSADGAA
jgi:hypothetical protein